MKQRHRRTTALGLPNLTKEKGIDGNSLALSAWLVVVAAILLAAAFVAFRSKK